MRSRRCCRGSPQLRCRNAAPSRAWACGAAARSWAPRLRRPCCPASTALLPTVRPHAHRVGVCSHGCQVAVLNLVPCPESCWT